MSMVEDLAAFVVKARYKDLSDEACRQAKIRMLEALGCAIGALDGGPIKAIREQIYFTSYPARQTARYFKRDFITS